MKCQVLFSLKKKKSSAAAVIIAIFRENGTINVIDICTSAPLGWENIEHPLHVR